MPSATRFHGTTAEQMNFRAAQGYASREELEAWARTQNPNLASIQWDVTTGIGIHGYECAQLTHRRI